MWKISKNISTHWTLRSGKNIRNYLKIPRKGHEAPRGTEKERGEKIIDLIGWLIKSLILCSERYWVYSKIPSRYQSMIMPISRVEICDLNPASRIPARVLSDLSLWDRRSQPLRSEISALEIGDLSPGDRRSQPLRSEISSVEIARIP